VRDVPHAWCRIGAAATGLALLRENNVSELVLAGGIRRPSLAALRPDWRAAKLFARIGRRALGDDGLLSAVVRELEQEGFRVIGADELLDAEPVPEGPLGKIRPDGQSEADIEHGLRVAWTLGVLDVGQSVIVQQGLVLGVEAIEGTDELLRQAPPRRTGRRARQGRETGSGAPRRPSDDRAAHDRAGGRNRVAGHRYRGGRDDRARSR
jgi:UDP-2,3-diacylglucosamine hydrolase